MARRTYRPHIKVQIGPRYNSLIGWIDFSAILAGTDWRWWECEGHDARGDGKTPKEAYDAWYRDLLMPYKNGSAFMDAYTNGKYTVVSATSRGMKCQS
jgi:hypothetical protein